MQIWTVMQFASCESSYCFRKCDLEHRQKESNIKDDHIAAIFDEVKSLKIVLDEKKIEYSQTWILI